MLRQALPLTRQAVGSPVGRNTIAQWPVTRPNIRDLQVQYLSLSIDLVLTLLPSALTPPNLQTLIPNRASMTLTPSFFQEPKAARQRRPSLHRQDLFCPPLLLLMALSQPQRL